MAFDAVAGDMTGDLVKALPPKGTVYVYGGVSEQNAGNIDPMQLIYFRKEVKGYEVRSWVTRGGSLSTYYRMKMASRKVNPGLMKDGWCSSQFKDVTLDKVQEEISNLLESSITGQKLRVRLDAS